MGDFKIMLGFSVFPYGKAKREINLTKTPHWLVVGGSGSGKSVFLMYVLNQLLELPISLYIADFKGSGDFEALTPNYAEFEACEALIEAFYKEFQRIKEDETEKQILLIFDEYAGFLVWLEGQDKKRATKIKNMIAEILMQGRALRGGGSAWFWCVCQRADSGYFSNGARENFMLSVGFSRMSNESKTMLGFHSEDIPAKYQPCTGKALLSVDGYDLSVLQVPKVDVEKLRKLLRKKAERRAGEAGATD